MPLGAGLWKPHCQHEGHCCYTQLLQASQIRICRINASFLAQSQTWTQVELSLDGAEDSPFVSMQSLKVHGIILSSRRLWSKFCFDLACRPADELRHEVREVLQQCYAGWRKQMDDHKQDMLVMPVQVSQPHESSNVLMKLAKARGQSIVSVKSTITCEQHDLQT